MNHSVIIGLVPVIPKKLATLCHLIEMAGMRFLRARLLTTTTQLMVQLAKVDKVACAKFFVASRDRHDLFRFGLLFPEFGDPLPHRVGIGNTDVTAQRL